MFFSSRASARRPLLVLGTILPALLVLTLPTAASHPYPTNGDATEGRAPTQEELRPAVEAAFARQSYARDVTASLAFFNSATGVRVQLFRSGAEQAQTIGNSELQGVPAADPSWVGTVRPGRVVSIAIGDFPTGLYFARLTAADGRVGFAPFVLRPRRLGEHRVAVVMPTLTWQAYNFRDDDGDGKGDTWYADWSRHTAGLARPFLERGVPPHFRSYDLPFLHWLTRTGRVVDYLADADLDAAHGRALAAAYDLIVFPGHHEYVTSREYDAVQQFRDLGGNLAFLSANDFFRRVDVRGNEMHLIGLWRDLGRPEASLIGVQYRANDEGQHRGPWTIRDAEAAPWLFSGTGLQDDMPFASGGVEIDKTADGSPKGVKVLADIRNLIGPGLTAQMTYYQTARGAKVFAAGAFTLAGAALEPDVSRLLENLWAHLSTP